MDLHEFYSLITTDERYLIVPKRSDGGRVSNECLCIDRITSELSLISLPVLPEKPQQTIFGIIGVFRLVAGRYLAVITRRQLLGEVANQIIYKVAEYEMFPYARTLLHLNESQIHDNKNYLSMIQSVLNMNGFYFSPTFDITHTLQRLDNTDPDFRHLSLLERADSRFVWNAAALRELSFPEFRQYAMPIMFGFVAVKRGSVAGRSFQMSLISRRSCFRAGVRFHTRGIDTEGNAANFVETEQIAEFEKELCSFVQTRGSIPLFWSQSPNLRWQPQPLVLQNADHLQGFSSHFETQMALHYPGKMSVVNLINKKGREKRIGDVLENVIRSYSNPDYELRYVPFDFHKECSNLRWDRLSLLIDQLRPSIMEYGYFSANLTGKVHSLQRGFFRTNCMDCLDRTNVVQSMIAKESLEHQLRGLNILQPDDSLSRYVEFDSLFKNTWADNGDVCSVQYAGTGALKADFTRLGQRTFYGALCDGWNACYRYYLNNFVDGTKLDAINLFLGNYTVEHLLQAESASTAQRDFILPIAAVFAFAMAVLTFTVQTDFIYCFFSFCLFLAIMFAIFYRGDTYVNKPKLQ